MKELSCSHRRHVSGWGLGLSWMEKSNYENADVVAAVKAGGWMAGSPWGADNVLGWTGLMFTCLSKTPPRYHSKPPPASSAFLTAIFSGSRPGKKKKWAIIWSAQSGPQITGRHVLSASARRLFTGGMEQLIAEGTAAPSYITINNIFQLLRVELPFSHLEGYRLCLTTKNIQKNMLTLKWIQVVGTHIPSKKWRYLSWTNVKKKNETCAEKTVRF